MKFSALHEINTILGEVSGSHGGEYEDIFKY
jgi:hypothetical protein